MIEKENLQTKKICNASKWAITGFMGAGKSWLIERLKLLGAKTGDLDQFIESTKGKSISDIIVQEGMEAFRDIETEKLKNYLETYDHFFLALGGGTLSERNLESLRFHGVNIIFIDTPFEVCLKRINNGPERPLAKLSKTKLEELYQDRLKFYKKADVTLKLKPDLNHAELKELLLNQGIKF